MARPLRIGLAQVASVPGDPEVNWQQALIAIEQAAGAGAQLVVFPEVFLQAYRVDELSSSTAAVVPGPWSDAVVAAAARHNVHIIIGLVRADAGFPHLVYNSALLAGPAGVVGCYDKVHLGTYLDYHEGVYWAPGRALPVFDTPLGRIGIQICYDMSFPETARVLALQGAELNVVLSAGPREFRQSWPALLEVRSRENRFFTVYVNTVGDQRGQWFFGGSRVVGPDGQVRFTCPEDTEAVQVGEIDLDEVAMHRRRQHLFRDRVPSLYGPLVETR